MTEFRTEVTIPVTRDARTFEQRRKDMLTNLERRTSNRRSERTNVVRGGTSDTTASTITADSSLGAPHFRHRDDWDEEVDQWIHESRRRWNEEMRQMRQDMFALEPVDDFGLEHWGGIRPIERQDEHSSMMAKMEREMESLRHKMDSMSPLGQTGRIGGSGGSSFQTSSSRVTTSSTKSSLGDPRTAKTQSNVKESIQQSRTVNGVTTGTSSQSSMSTTSSGADVHKLVESNTPGALIPHGNASGVEMMGFLKNAYELDDDGQVHFKVRFDAKDFDPEDIDVTTVENRLTVNAKKNIKTGSSETTKEFSRTIDLPQSIDHEHFRCNLTEDGVLILDAPVKAPDYDAITFDKGHHLSIRPKSETELKSSTSTTKTTHLAPMGISGPTILKDGVHGRKLHLEVQVDPEYSADDVCVRTDANSIVVSGKQKTSGGSALREFTKTYDIPETVDPFTVTAQLIGSTLVIEAPLLCTV